MHSLPAYPGEFGYSMDERKNMRVAMDGALA
jgi:hypothetical protein